MNNCNVVLFAAGLGTRLRPATEKHPKPVLPLNHYPLGCYALPYLDCVDVGQLVVNTFYLPEQIHNLYKPMIKDVIFSDEKDFIKGSAGGLKLANNKFKLSLPIVAMNADEIFFTNEADFVKNALSKHNANLALATLIVTEHPEAGHQFGAIWCENDRVVHIGKDKPNSTAKPWHFIGLQILSPAVINLISKNLELNIFYDILIHHLKTENIQIYPIKCDWYEVGNISDYQKTKAEINQKILNTSMYKSHYQKLLKYQKSELSDLTE